MASIASFSGGDPWYNITVRNDTHYVADFDYYASRVTKGVDFRSKNIEAFDNLEKFNGLLCICKKFISSRSKTKNF